MLYNTLYMFASFGVCTGIPYSHGLRRCQLDTRKFREAPMSALKGCCIEARGHGPRVFCFNWRNLVDFCTNSCAKNYLIILYCVARS